MCDRIRWAGPGIRGRGGADEVQGSDVGRDIAREVAGSCRGTGRGGSSGDVCCERRDEGGEGREGWKAGAGCEMHENTSDKAVRRAPRVASGTLVATVCVTACVALYGVCDWS